MKNSGPPKGKIKKFGKKQVVKTKSRKDQRKEKRQLKKVNRKEYFDNKAKYVKGDSKQQKKGPATKNQKSKPKNGKPKANDPEEDVFDEDDEEIPSDEFGTDAEDDKAPPPPTPRKKKLSAAEDPTQRFRSDLAKEKGEQKAMSKGMRKRRIEQLMEENEEEDRLIKKLEKRLKIDHSRAEKAVPKCFDDGFDYILEMCLPENINKMYQAAQEANEASDMDDGFADDLNIATGKETKATKADKKKQAEEQKMKKKASKLQAVEKKYFDMDSDGEDSEFAEDSDDNVQELPTKTVRNAKFPKNKKQAPLAEQHEEEVDYNDSEDSEMGEEDSDEDDEDDEDQNSDISEAEDQCLEDAANSGDSDGSDSPVEDIYGRKRGKDGKVLEEVNSTKYVPPHLRLKPDDPEDAKRNEKLLRLRRLLKGSLNRLAEQNLHKISTEIEQLYMQNSRHDMNETITKLLTDALISRSLSPERMVLEHCLLIAVLHGNVGTEVGAHFLTDLVKRFDALVQKLSLINVEDKELDNVVQILSHLYTYKVFDCSLIFEMLQRLTVTLGEKNIECVLLVLKAVGFALRKDDPLALKEFIMEVQKKAQTVPEQLKENTRLKFMLDILMAVKNNNVNKIPNYDDTVSQHLRKVLKTVLGAGKYVSTLKIPMEDLLQSEERGKWWVVGSAWTGKSNAPAMGSAIESKINRIVNSDSISAKLLALAKKHRMSTEDRKNVFCIIMSAEDYIDAFEKLLHLAIKDHKVIVSVLIHCCLSEKTYNPYYSALAQKFCDFDRKYQLGFQYSAWDRIKEIESLTPAQVTNFAKFIAHLIMEGGQPLSILKIVEFGALNKQTMKFVRQILLTILLKDEETCKNVSDEGGVVVIWRFILILLFFSGVCANRAE